MTNESIATIFTHGKALEITLLLNSDHDDEWEYRLVPINEDGSRCRIAIYDEDGLFTGNL